MGQAVCSFEAKVALHSIMAMPLALALVCVIFMTPGEARALGGSRPTHVKTVNVTRLCKQQQIVTVNGQFPVGNTFRILVQTGKIYLLRIISAIFTITPKAHTYDGKGSHRRYNRYTNNNDNFINGRLIYQTILYRCNGDIMVIYPGQTTDFLFIANQVSGSYYMAARAYRSGRFVPCNSNLTVHEQHYSSLFPSVPATIDQEMLITKGIGLVICPPNTCTALGGLKVVGSFNNISFARPRIAILQAYFLGIARVYTTDFPSNSPLAVQIVFQGTDILSNESHPVHIHGFDFYVVGQGFGNYDSQKDPQNFNLVDPPRCNTIRVRTGGWVAIRFKADNPGVWFVHCHFEVHSDFGFNMVFLVENGPGANDK
ncbi:laccase-4-like [Cryptomeria japonica]|uniref:laccase-4-like n=1 Tax=Cryptomeria japonica TaxID=3369 RepID=UPI0025ABBDA1|nr:laccase-4-like [Cryptomeria japonica]